MAEEKRKFEIVQEKIAAVDAEIASLAREIGRAERAVRRAIHYRERCVERLRPHCPHEASHREPVSPVASGGYRYVVCNICGACLGEEYRLGEKS